MVAARTQTVQDLPDATKEGQASFFWMSTQRGFILPPWATRERERALRRLFHHEYNWMGQAAFAGLTKRWAATPWEIKGNRRVHYFQELLRGADFGRGWDVFVQKVGLDFLRQDGGAYIEVIAPGNPRRSPTGAVTGLAHLDSLRCYPTGDPEFPIVYYSRKGKMHLMHHTRVVQLVDQPDGDEDNPGYGTCALSRAISIVMRQIHMNRYVEANLDDKPPPGMVVASNVGADTRNKAFAVFQAEQSADEMPPWGRTVWFYSLDPAQPAKLEFVTFSRPPDKFDFKQYTELDVNAWAFALGVDVQEFWQLTGGNLGSGQQSEVLHAKSQGRTYGAFLTQLERVLNNILPESLTYEFKTRDAYEAQERAQTATLWASFAASVGEAMTPDEKRRMLANQVEAFADAVTDENGEVIRLSDADPEPETEQVADDTTVQPTDRQPPEDEQTADSEKALIDNWRADFADLISAAQDDDMTRRRFGTVMRGLIRRYGLEAYREGLRAGGVTDGALDQEDQATFAALLASHSAYVTAFGNELYDDGLTAAEVRARATAWFNKTISAFEAAGRLSADSNGMYEFAGTDGAESCPTCKRLKGQRHRYKTWARRRLRPRVDTDNFDCGGWECNHYLARTTGSASGRL